LIVGSGLAESYHMRWFSKFLDKQNLTVKAECLGLVGLSIAGPKSREVIQKLTQEDMSNAGFPFMAIKQMQLGMVPAIVGRVSYTGDLGYEIWIKPEYQRRLYHDLMEAGAQFDISLFGSRALNALRLEKNYGSWAREYRPIYFPHESGLERFVAYTKPADFIGKAAATKARDDDSGAYRLRSFIIDAKDADVIGDEPISYQGAVCGWVTSGGYAHGSGVSVAMGYVPKEYADDEKGWSVEVLGDDITATMQKQPLFDSNMSRMRS